jgi:hypothetical protein
MKDRFKRQGFLGEAGQRAIERVRVAICGLGGGGSILAVLLAHLGVLDFVLFDGDVAEAWNLNRTITLTEADITAHSLKVNAAERRIKEIRSAARVEKYDCCWQDRPEVLRGCDVAFGSIDGFQGRDELEKTCRRFLLPLIDLGMDVRTLKGHRPRMAGQVILSMPGEACMWCMGFLDDQKMALEDQRYGDAGDNPQVVWALSHLASSAVGIFVNLLTDWTGSLRERVHLVYRGNEGTINPCRRLPYVPRECPHHPLDQVGEPRLRAV